MKTKPHIKIVPSDSKKRLYCCVTEGTYMYDAIGFGVTPQESYRKWAQHLKIMFDIKTNRKIAELKLFKEPLVILQEISELL
jgi:hypothetical protein